MGLTFEEIALLPGNVGLDTPMTYEQAALYVTEGTQWSLGQLGRSKQGIKEYQRFKEQILLKYVSLVDFIKITKLSFESRTGDAGKLSAIEPTAEPVPPKVLWIPNDFPYSFEAGVQHDCIWSTKPMTPEAIEATIQQRIPEHEHVWFVNPPELGSIPGVWHCHVLSRPCTN